MRCEGFLMQSGSDISGGTEAVPVPWENAWCGPSERVPSSLFSADQICHILLLLVVFMR